MPFENFCVDRKVDPLHETLLNIFQIQKLSLTIVSMDE